MTKKVVMLVGDGKSSVLMYNGIAAHVTISKVIVEQRMSSRYLIKKRIKRLGLFKVLGQLIFQVTVPRLWSLFSRKRLKELQSHLNNTPIPATLQERVPSVNSEQCIALLQKENPDIVIVNGTRIISREVLNCIDATFINTHMGITPKYRGVHGGYWALANKDRGNCGVTVHLIDTGIDTGAVVYQKNINPTAQDNFKTYPYLQLKEGIELMKKAIADVLNNNLKIKEVQTMDSKLWYHPTILYYLKKWVFTGVK